MDAQRRAFLDTVIDDLTISRSPDSTAAPARRAKSGLRVNRAIAGAFLAGVSFLAFSATAAHAAPPTRPTGVVIQSDDCWEPNFTLYDHTKPCPGGIAFMSYHYLYSYSPNQAVICFVFDASYFGCGGQEPIGRKEACNR